MDELPKLDLTESYYLEAFFMLSGSRQSGFGISQIPLSEITNYGLVFGTVHDLETFCKIITRVDAAFVKLISSKKSNEGG